MADTGQKLGGSSRRDGDFVVRRFSGVRIERLLLTRLFDLTSGLRCCEEMSGSLNDPQRSETVGQPREAA